MPATVGYATGVATLNPDGDLAYATTYTATVDATVSDVAGNPLGTDVTWSFTTVAAPEPPSGFTDTIGSSTSAREASTRPSSPTPRAAR